MNPVPSGLRVTRKDQSGPLGGIGPAEHFIIIYSVISSCHITNDICDIFRQYCHNRHKIEDTKDEIVISYWCISVSTVCADRDSVRLCFT